jgi:transcriptional regulator with XRE-family HTH domain
MEFEKRIKGLRKAAMMTASQLAVTFNRSEGAVRSWETGRTKPDADTLIELAKFFHVTVDYLLGLVDEIDPEYTKAVASLGLKEDAIKTIEHYQKTYASDDPRTLLDILNLLLSRESNFGSLLATFGMLSNDIYLARKFILTLPDGTEQTLSSEAYALQEQQKLISALLKVLHADFKERVARVS